MEWWNNEIRAINGERRGEAFFAKSKSYPGSS